MMLWWVTNPRTRQESTTHNNPLGDDSVPLSDELNIKTKDFMGKTYG
jgi:hypothetical protein